MEEVNKIKMDVMRFRFYEVILDLICEVQPGYSKTYFMKILRCFDDHHM